LNIPRELFYTESHEWAKVDGNKATVGITDYAQHELGDIVYIELPEVGREVKKGEVFGSVESVKAVSDLYSPLSGKVIEVNDELSSHPEFINQDPYGKGWIIKIEIKDEKERNKLMNAESYELFVKEESGK
jgi:glycine cleavage system H protein